MDILDLQLQYHWVWVLQMSRSYSVMAFNREVWTRKFQREGATTGRFMTTYIIPFQIIVVANILIYLPLPLKIYPTHIKEHGISQICFQLPYLLPLKI